MKRHRADFHLLSIVIILVLLTLSGPSFADQGSTDGWVCPPCGHEHDDEVFDAPGTCPRCGMQLITTVERQRRVDRQIQAAILVFDGVQIIDFTGPYEVFGQARFNVFTVSESGAAITTAMGMKVQPTYSFANSPEPDILLVPGGTVHAQEASPEVRRWVRQNAERADHVLSVCNGAFILAAAGLLDGLEATTFYGLLDSLRETYPKVEVVRDKRYTDNGKILTSAGLSSGIDAAIYLVSKIRGEARARSLALHLEYAWDPDEGFVRGALADRHMPNVEPALPAEATVSRLSSFGDREHWETRLAVDTALEPAGIVEAFARPIKEVAGWKRLQTPGPDQASWQVKTSSDGLWTAHLQVEEDAAMARYLVVVTLERAVTAPSAR